MGNSESNNNIDGSDCSDCADLLINNNIKDLKDFRKWSKLNHPDKGGNENTFAEVSSCADEFFKQEKCDKNILEKNTYTSPSSESKNFTKTETYNQPKKTWWEEEEEEEEQEQKRKKYDQQKRENEKWDRLHKEYQEYGLGGKTAYEQKQRDKMDKEKELNRLKKETDKWRKYEEEIQKENISYYERVKKREQENINLQKMKIKSNNRKNYVKDDIVKVMSKYADTIYTKYISTKIIKKDIEKNRKIIVKKSLEIAIYIINKNHSFKNFMNGEDVVGINETIILKAIEQYIKKNINLLIKVANDTYYEDL